MCLDLISIPDFLSGAMEQWGLITFRETALLIDEQIASPGNIKRVAEVIGHELAHMWFGNLGNFQISYHFNFLSIAKCSISIIINLNLINFLI